MHTKANTPITIAGAEALASAAGSLAVYALEQIIKMGADREAIAAELEAIAKASHGNRAQADAFRLAAAEIRSPRS